MSLLRPLSLKRLIRNSAPKGFTLTENLVALMILSITLAVMFPAFFSQSMESSKSRRLSGAVTVANSTLNDFRRMTLDELDTQLGETTEEKEQLGFKYQVTRYVCTELTNTSDPGGTCSTAPNNQIRKILVKIEVNNEPVYNVQTAFTLL
ncbi:MAG: type II secretion system protein [Cyanobacteriota bacterium]|jgi:prepilin-type N-terminal cleavage/methylation domain-containing protein